METKVKNREWVKDAAIIFLAVLLVLTFFSNTIMNRTLPEVATASVHEGAIVAKVRGTGVVTATGKHQVKAKETRTIRAVMVKVGQEVNAGDVLFVLGEGDETEMEQAMERLRTLRSNYQRTAVSAPVFDYSSYNRAIDTATLNLEKAQREYDEAVHKAEAADNAVTAAAKKRYEAAKDRAEQLEYDYAQRKEARIKELETEIADLTAQKEQMEEATRARIEEAQARYDELVGTISFWETERQRAQEVFDVVSDPGSGATVEERVAAQNAVTEAINALTGFSAQLPAVEEELNQALAERNTDAYLAIVNGIEVRTEEIRALSNDELHYDEVRAAIEERDKLYNEYLAQIGTVAEDLKYAEYALMEAEIGLQAAYDSLAAAQESNSRSAAATGVELQSIAEEIAVLQEKIKSLAGDESNTVLADVPGTVSTIEVTAGDTVLKSALMATLEVPDMGYTLSFSVTNDQAQRLRIGDTATVSNYYWGNSVTATLNTIRTDPKNPQGGKILVFDLTGDVTAGSELSISVGQKSANYDLVVPNSAIKSDSNGSFVLAVSVKSSPLGNRYTARRVSVEVKAKDDSNSAVVADLANGDFVVTTSSAPIKSGDMVRLAESG